MSRTVDIASDAELHTTELLIKEVQGRVKTTTYTHCRYCGEPTGEGVGFCNVDCRNDYDEEERIRQNQGLRRN